MTILVTGATGNVGGQVIAQAPGAVRALSRTPGRFPAHVETVSADLSDPVTLIPALRGVEAVFLMWPLHTAAALPGVLEVIGAHARRVVYLGSGGVADLTMDEQLKLFARSGLEWTVIRPSTFAVNALWWSRQIRAGDVVRGIHGDLAMAMLHEADIAAVAVRALTDTACVGEVYDLTGPAALTQAEQVRVIGEVLGRPLRWEEVSRAAAREQLLTDDFPESFVDVLLDAYTAMSAWPAPAITATVAQVTGSSARDFQCWVADHAGEFAA